MKSFIRYTLISIVLTTFSITLFGQERYWVNGSGSWSDPMHWSLTSGGPAGADVPMPDDDVFIDKNSFTGDGQYILIDQISFAKNITWGKTGYKPTLKGNEYIVLKEALNLVGKIDNQYTGRIIDFGDFLFSNNNLEGISALYDAEFNRLVPMPDKASKSAFTMVLTDTIPETCYGTKDGIAIVQITSGGTPPFKYYWYWFRPIPYQYDLVRADTLYEFSDTVKGLYPGGYWHIQIEDDDETSYDINFSIDAATKIFPDIESGGSAQDTFKLCYGESLPLDGNPTGGQGAPYKSHLWTGNGAGDLTDFTIQTPTYNSSGSVAPGTYKLIYTATDNNDCVGSDSVVIVVNPLPLINKNIINDTVCYGFDAAIVLEASENNISYQLRTEPGNGNVGTPEVGDGSDITITAPAASLAELDNYFNVLATNTITSCVDSMTIEPIVYVKPLTNITSQPVSVSVCPGDDTSFTVVATGSGTLTYQWQKSNGGTWTDMFDGGRISGANTNKLSISNINSGDADDYHCIISSDCPDVTSNPATLTVNTEITITSQPVNVNDCPGANISFSTSGTGTGLNYQWQKEIAAVWTDLSDGGKITGSLASTLNISNIAAAEEGNYRCIVKGDCDNDTTNTAVLTLKTEITITSQPVNVADCPGANIFFSTSGTGTGLNYQWQKEIAAVWTDLSDGGKITGSLASTLNISNIAAAEAGNYRCIVKGDCDNDTTVVATLTLNPITQIITDPTDTAACEGYTISFHVSAIGTDTLVFTWQKENGGAWNVLSNGGRISGATDSILTITGVIPADADNYRVIVHSDCGIDITSAPPAALTVYTVPALSITGLNSPYCQGEPADTLYGTPQDANGLFTGNGIADNGDGTAYFTPSIQGTYNITYTYTTINSCVDSVFQSVTVNPLPDTLLAVSDDQVCSYEDAQVVVTTGQSGMTYFLRWDNDNRIIAGPYIGDGVSDITFTVLSDSLVTGANVFNVYASTVAGCSAELQDKSTITKLTDLTTTVFTDSVNCNGGSDGSAWVVAVGGSGTYTYFWNTPPTSTNDTIFNRPTGAYPIEVTDAQGCIAYDTAYIGQPDVLVIDSIIVKNVLCYGMANGSITVYASGGTRPYLYSVEGDDPLLYQSDSVFQNLIAGSYNVIVKDVNGCKTSIVPATITEPDIINYDYSVTNISGCNGDKTGAIYIENLSGGTGVANLFCALSTIETTNPDTLTFGSDCSYINLPGGNYWVYIQDIGSGCIDTANGGNVIAITQPSAIIFTVTGITNVTGCYYNTNGQINTTASGGTPPYTFWRKLIDETTFVQNTTTPERIFRNLGVGTHVIQVRDAHDCRRYDTVVITGPAPIVINSVTVDSASCAGYANGSITVYASGGTGALNYSITGGTAPLKPVGTAFDTTAGTYNIRIIDASGCIKDTTITIFEPAPIIITSPVQYTQITCNGLNDGQIIIEATGGAGGLTYSIDGGANYFATDTFSGLSPDTFYVAVQDINGCVMFSDTIYMIEPAAITVDSTEFTNIVCNNDDNGTITVYASGGSGTLTYNLYDLATHSLQMSNTTGSFTGLSGDTYTVEVDNANGCGPVVADTFIIINPPALFISVDSADNVTCNGDTDGAIYTTSGGGTGTLSYTLYNSTDSVTTNLTGDFTGLPAEDYYIVMTDSMGCSITTTPVVTITEPDTISIAVQTAADISCYGSADGLVYVQPTGGTAPYTMTINTSVPVTLIGNDATFNNLDAGSYVVSVTDDNNCDTVYSDTLVILEPALLTFDSSEVAGMSCNGDSATITIYATGGVSRTIQYSIDSGYTYVNTNVFTGLTADTYYTAVRYSGYGCDVFGDTIVITEPTTIAVTTVDTTHIMGCAGTNIGGLEVSASGGGGSFIYIINTTPADTNFINGVFDSLYAGSYVVTAVDQYGCTGVSNTISVLQPEALNLGYALTGPTCTDSTDAAIMVSITGGYIPYTYEIMIDASETNSTGLFDSLTAGIYVVQATDDAGCAAISDTIEITNPAPVVITASAVYDERCAGTNDGYITLTASGGASGYEYSTDGINWDTLDSLTGLSPNTYYPQVRDQNGCLFTDTAHTVAPKDTIAISSNITHPIVCYGDSNGNFTVLATGGNSEFTYYLPGDTNVIGEFDSLAAGNYNVYAVDILGCIDSMEIELISPDPIITSTDSTFNDITNKGTITLTIDSGGVAPYEYQIIWGPNEEWSDPTTSNTYEHTDLDSGLYTLFVRDVNNCYSDAEIVHLLPSGTNNYWNTFGSYSITTWPECPNDNYAYIFYTIPSDAEYPVYYWFIRDTVVFTDTVPKGGSNKIQRTLALTTYYVIIQDSVGKIFLDTIEVTAPNKIRPKVRVNNITCNLHESNGQIVFDTVTGGTPIYTYQFINYPDTFTTSLDNHQSGIGDTGVHVVRVIDEHGCLWDSTVVMGYDTIVDAYAGIEDTAFLCWYYDEYELHPSGGHTYNWKVDPSYSSLPRDSAFRSVFALPDSINYFRGDSSLRIIVTATKYNRCYDSDTIMMVVTKKPGLELLTDNNWILYGDSVSVLALNGSLFDSLWWYQEDTVLMVELNNDTTVAFKIDSNIFYIAKARTEYYCYEYDTVAFMAYGTISAPSGFSPNGDPWNQTWVIENSFGYPNMVVEVYNRWGEKVFISEKGYPKPWDGTRNNKPLPTGTYYYVIYPNMEGYENSSGTVTILR